MLTHQQIWQGIDRLALRNGFSPSGLAKRAGLDPTTFNKSKRVTQDGKQRWPGTESLSKILDATQTSMADFVSLIDEYSSSSPSSAELKFKAIRFSQISDGVFDASGFPKGADWEINDFPSVDDPNAYIIELDKEVAGIFCRVGSLLVISPSSSVRRHDRVIVKSLNGDLRIGTLARKSSGQVIIADESDETIQFASKDIAWMARIVWVSQ